MLKYAKQNSQISYIMNDKNADSKSYYWIIVGLLLSWTGIAGIVDGIIEWKIFFIRFFEHYKYFRNLLLGWIPFKIPTSLADYLVVGSGITVIVRMVRIQIVKNMKNEDEDDTELGDQLKMIDEYIKHNGRLKYYMIIIKANFQEICNIGIWNWLKNINERLVGHYGRKPRLNDYADVIIFVYPVLNLVLWPYTLFGFRSIFAAFYKREQKMALRIFFSFWFGLIVVLFLLVDFKKTFPKYF